MIMSRQILACQLNHRPLNFYQKPLNVGGEIYPIYYHDYNI